ncbi:uncharacterized protein LOC130138506 [Syzygium oleosum]|uniref:uncharacterized protein LOC130138506 n=1 Tax=Syzygium oleosum TaxID=219896 RepID=UPI0024B9CAA6|nr:uncharacterized protein LOC130138506 [Syzygium oleosum]
MRRIWMAGILFQDTRGVSKPGGPVNSNRREKTRLEYRNSLDNDSFAIPIRLLLHSVIERVLNERAKGGRLTFKGEALASRSKSIDKKQKKKRKQKLKDAAAAEDSEIEQQRVEDGDGDAAAAAAGQDIYPIDAAKKMKYEELFPVEAR